MKYEDINKDKYPLGFLINKGTTTNSEDLNKTFVSHTRQMALLQKETIGYEGDLNSHSWRLTSDEGGHLKGSDLAPFPLGFFNASIHGDVVGRILKTAKKESIIIDEIKCEVKNSYYLTGSFVKGDGKGHAEPTEINLEIKSPENKSKIERLVNSCTKKSPVLTALRTSLKNTFSLIANGRRKKLSNLNESEKNNPEDPYQFYTKQPSPNEKETYSKRMILKTGKVSDGKIEPVDGYNVSASSGDVPGNENFNKIIRTIVGNSCTKANDDTVEVDTVLGLPGMSHFIISMDINGVKAPSPVNIMGAAISFCFLTQTHRYIHHQKFNIEGLRMSQYITFKESSNGSLEILPLDTHLFVNGTASDEDNEKLIDMSERTCYLHATLAGNLDPKINFKVV
tara:strand:- start:5379 stop:6566 length:1188 start_codon:yes stop_codon:yes gene_type:complete